MGDGIGVNEIAVGGVALILIIERGLTILKSRGIDLKLMGKLIEEISKNVKVIFDKDMIISNKIDALYAWHDVNAPDGRKIWYDNNKEICKALEKIGDAMETSTKLMQEIHTQNTIMFDRLKRGE